jgi:hypothetical protein
METFLGAFVSVCISARVVFLENPLQTVTSHLPLKHVQFTHQNKRFVLKQLFQSMFRVCFGPKQFVFVKQQNRVKFFIFFQQFIFFQFQTVDPCEKKEKQQKDNATLTNQEHCNPIPTTTPLPARHLFLFRWCRSNVAIIP